MRIAVTYTLALGPFMSFWSGPQRLLLTIERETVVDVEYQGGYNARGCAERLPALDLAQGLHLVYRMSSPAAHANALAFCQALEKLAKVEIPARAAVLRTALAEVERLQSHLEVLVGLLGALGMEHTRRTLEGLLHYAREAMYALSGRPDRPELCIPGGLAHDFDERQHEPLRQLLDQMRPTLLTLIKQTIEGRGVLRRTVNIGTLTSTVVQQFGLSGPMARAAGLVNDVRLDEPYAAYHQLEMRRVRQEGGDVNARLVVLLFEAYESVQLVGQLLEQLPAGAWQHDFPTLPPAGMATSVVESPQGTLRYALFADGEQLTGAAITAPRQLDRLLARTLFLGALVDNVVLIALSTDHCTACAEG